jgi:hypothetical protein
MAVRERLMSAVDDGPITPLVYSVDQAARLLGIGRSTAYELIAQHQGLLVDRVDGQVFIPVLRIGRRTVLPRQAVTQAVEGTPT